MCHFPISHKGWLRQLRPSVSAKTIIRFERLVDSQLGNRTKPADIANARLNAYREMGYCHVE